MKEESWKQCQGNNEQLALTWIGSLSREAAPLRCIFLLQAELNSVKQQGHEALQQLETRLHGYEAQSAEIQAFLQDKAFILQEAAEAEARLEAERQSAAMRLR